MSLERMDTLLIAARKNRYAVAAFECWNSANIYAIAEGAAQTDMPVIFQASHAEYTIMGGADALFDIVSFYIRKKNITAALHLDHGISLEQVEECAKAGFSSVMLDASRLSFEENIKLSKQAAEIANEYKISIECELGHVAGAEGGMDDIDETECCMTDPEKAEIFVKKTNADCLAVAIGTVHGDYRSKPNIDLKLLEQISDIIEVPLVLHGGSGTPPKTLKECINRGIAKINICTDIHKIWLDGIEKAKTTLTPSVPGKFYQPAQEMLVQAVTQKIELFKNER
ncbi:MAG: ketose-bisphosphate aldolase [Sedimentisphaeraceae bacterium JB056]